MNFKSIWTYVIVFAVVFAASFYFLKSKQTAQIEDFDSFYEQFLTDSTFQMSRINFPLEGLPSHADSLDFADGYYWERSNWRMHRKMDYQSLGYERQLNATENLIIETLVHPKGYGVQRRFMTNEQGKWYLIYYAGQNAVKIGSRIG